MNGALLLARGFLALHVLFVAFVVLGPVCTLTGSLLRWKWVRNRAFRLSHVAAISFILLRSWCGVPCILTSVEIWFRERAGNGASFNDCDRIGELLVLRGADADGFRRAATAWAALTMAMFAQWRAPGDRVCGKRRWGN